MKLASALLATMLGMGCGMAPTPGGPGPGSDPGTGGDPGTGTGSDPLPVPGSGPVTEVSGHITANTTWTDTVHITGDVIINAGVTVTVAAGTVVNVTSPFGITVSGTLAIQGTKDRKVTFQPADVGTFWSHIVVPSGGVMTASYLVQTSSGLTTSNSGKITLVDTQLSHAGGDLLMMSGGTLDMSYSGIGLASGRDTTHCNMHVSGGVQLKVTHSNLSTASFGLMFYGGVNADFTHNNWFGNGTDVDTEAAYPVTGDFSYSYFAKGAPTNPGITATNMATAPLTDAGPR
jgi:hypothetical protein